MNESSVRKGKQCFVKDTEENETNKNQAVVHGRCIVYEVSPCILIYADCSGTVCF